MPADRQIKKKIYGKPHTAFVVAPDGWADICQDEIDEIITTSAFAKPDRPRVTVEERLVRIDHLNFRHMLELTYRLTTARDIYWCLGEGRATSLPELAKRLAKVEWPLILRPGTRLKLTVQSWSSRLFHESMLRDHLRREMESRGFVCAAANETAEQRLILQLDHNRLRLLLSLAGQPLFRRGYKTVLDARASLREHLAAAFCRFARQDVPACGPSVIYNPFCGSGTLGFESLIQLAAITPVLFPRSYAVDSLVCSPPDTVRYLKDKFKNRGDAQAVHSLVFEDIDPEPLLSLRENVKSFTSILTQAGFSGIPAIQVHCRDFIEGEPLIQNGSVFVVMNPPFGGRLARQRAELKRLYRQSAVRLSRIAERTLVYGFVMCPDDDLTVEFCGGLQSFQLKHRPAVHGGQRLSIVAFHSRKSGEGL